MKHLLRNVGVAGLVVGAVALAVPGQASGQEEPLPELIQLEASISTDEVELGSGDQITVTSVDPCPEAEPAFDSVYWGVYTAEGGEVTPAEMVPLNEDGSWSLTTPVPDAADVYFGVGTCFSSAWTELPETLHFYEVSFTVVDPADPTPPTSPEEPPTPPTPPVGPQPAPPVAGDPGFTG